jgi:hypothetical protein
VVAVAELEMDQKEQVVLADLAAAVEVLMALKLVELGIIPSHRLHKEIMEVLIQEVWEIKVELAEVVLGVSV